jgi:hypothetical protein
MIKMALNPVYKQWLNTIIRAAKDNNLCLMECKEVETGKMRAVLCAVAFNGKDYVMTPFGHLCEGNPYEAYITPMMEESQS